jgi:cell division protein FtsQ
MKNPKTPAPRRRGQPRRRAVPVWRNRVTLRAAAALVVALVAGGGWWLWHGGWVGRTVDHVRWEIIAASADMGFTVQDILVVGRHETPRDQLLATLRLARGAPILAFDLTDAKRRVEELPWIGGASIERQLPSTILLRIAEREPLALWQHKGRFALIDNEGSVIPAKRLERFSDLLVVVGEDAPAHTAELLKDLAGEPNLMARVQAAARVGGRRWNVRLDNGIDVRLPEENTASAWARLAEYERTHRVLARDVRVLDLRLPDRLIVRRAQPGKTTTTGRET